MAKILQSPIILPPESISKNTITRQAFSLGRAFAVTFQISSSNLKLIATESIDENGEIITEYTSEPDTDKELGFSIFLTDDTDAHTFGASAGRCGWIDYSTKGEIAEGINDNGDKVIINFDAEPGNINTNLDLLLDHVYPENINNLVKNQTPGLKSIFSMLFLSNKTFFNAVTDAYGNLYYDSLIVDANGNVTDFLTGELKPISEYQAPVVIQYSIGKNIHYMVYDFIFEDNPIDILNINYYTFRLLFENHGGILTLEIMKPGETFYRPCMTKELPYNYYGNHNIRFGFGQFTPLFSYDIAKKANFNIHNIQLQQSDERPDWLKMLDKELKNLLDMETFNTELLGAENKLVLSVDLDIGDKLEDVKTLLEKIVPANIAIELYWIDGLPMSYTRLEYLESTGAQYIDTGVFVRELYAEIRAISTERTAFFASVHNTQSKDTFSLGEEVYTDGRLPSTRADVQNAGTYIWNGKQGLSFGDEFFTYIDMPNKKTNANGQIKSLGNFVWEHENNKVYLFAPTICTENTEYNRFAGYATGRLKLAVLKNAGVPAANYIPALNPSGVPGMFDTVTKTFKKSATSTPFVAGLNLQQVRDINLPVPGTVSILSLSIPCEVYNDSEAWGAIEAAQQKGWTFTFYWTDVVEYLTPQLNDIVGSGNYTIAYDYQTCKLSLAFALSVTTAQIDEVESLLDRVLSSNIVKEMEWADGLPMTYARLEYIESVGLNANGQFIATTVYPTPDTWVDTNMCPLEDYNVNNGFTAPTDSYRGFGLLIATTYGNAQAFYWPPVGMMGIGKMCSDWGVMGNFRLKDKKIYVNGTHLTTCSDTPWNATGVLGLGGVGDIQRSKTRFGTFKMGIGEETQVDFIPALDPTGAPCMFDIVTKTPFYNDGTGDFIYPGAEQAVMTLDLDLDAKNYAKLTEHGVRRLYHVPKGYTGSMDEYAAENGFKELVEPPMPLEGYWTPQWRETETQLILDWVETEPPVEEEITLD